MRRRLLRIAIESLIYGKCGPKRVADKYPITVGKPAVCARDHRLSSAKGRTTIGTSICHFSMFTFAGQLTLNYCAKNYLFA
jgi:hypothetical protein